MEPISKETLEGHTVEELKHMLKDLGLDTGGVKAVLVDRLLAAYYPPGDENKDTQPNSETPPASEPPVSEPPASEPPVSEPNGQAKQAEEVLKYHYRPRSGQSLNIGGGIPGDGIKSPIILDQLESFIGTYLERIDL